MLRKAKFDFNIRYVTESRGNNSATIPANPKAKNMRTSAILCKDLNTDAFPPFVNRSESECKQMSPEATAPLILRIGIDEDADPVKREYTRPVDIFLIEELKKHKKNDACRYI